ncbi:WD40 repeat-like protein, partial [Aureobasidium melanogenum]
MQAILPGRPQAQLQAVSTGAFEGQTVICYISGSALIICNGPDSLVQTIYHDDLLPPSALVAVAYDHRSAKIATASNDNVYIYVLREEIKGQLRWFLDMTFSLAFTNIRTLSWGTDDELLVASDKIFLLSTQDHSTRWTRSLPSPVSHATFSPSAALLATTSQYDRLVKVWRRLSFESAIFDYAYLSHPDIVTHVEWKKDSADEDVLYTICLDGRLRVWKTGLPRQTDVLGLYADLDLTKAVRPLVPTNRRHVFLVPSSVFSDAVEHAVNNPTLPAERHAVEYMKELAKRNPDIVVVTDDQGHMSAWGLENVGGKKRTSDTEHGDFFHATHVENLFFDFSKHAHVSEDNARIINFALPGQPGDIALLVHHFDGRLQWYQSSVHHIFDPSPRKHRMRNLASWTGHSSSIKKLIRTANGSAVISRTDTDEGVVWKHRAKFLVRKSKVKLQEHIHRTVLLEDGDFVVLLHHESISLWDARLPNAKEIGRCAYSVPGKPLCLVLLPAPEDAGNLSYLATVTADMHGVVWELDLAARSPTINEFCAFQLDRIENMSYFLPVDPAGSSPVVFGLFDTFAQDVAVSWTTTGILQTWTAKVDRQNKSVTWLNISTTDTTIQDPSLGSGTSIRKAALVDKSRSTLTIWDTKSGRLDYEETFENQTIQDLDWASTPDNQSILAVGFPHSVFVYTQLRYDYVTERPSWGRIKQINVRNLSPHPIGDSVWLGSGNLIIGAGNQLYLAGNEIDPQKDLSPDLQSSTPHKSSTRIHDVVRRLNGPLPVFHPQFISQCILAGKMDIVHRILLNLQKTLKFYTEGDDLDSFQGLDIDDFMSSTKKFSNSSKQLHKSYSTLDMEEESTAVTEEVAQSLVSLLSEKSVPQLSSTEQLSLADIIECVGMAEKHRRSIDENAARYLLFWRETVMRSRQSSSSAAVTWREMLWAYHSSSQDILVDLVTLQNKGQMTWSHARDTGVFVWLTDREALLQQFEAVARSAYTSTELRDPVNCSLHYLALRKKNVLTGLWRMATWSREQAATMRLLKNDFTDPRWRTAANKNAYALMGKRRFEYAAAFFLLADNLDSAVSVLSNQLGDVQLAIAVARVYGGDDSPSLKKFLNERVLPNAALEGNRCQATWTYWMLGERSLAVRALVSPLHSLLDPPGSPPDSLQAKSFRNDDPALVVLYQQLREKSLQTLRGALMISGNEEWEFITKTATLLLRMGCDILALDLVRHWEFLQPPPVAKQEEEEVDESVAELPRRKLSRTMTDDFDPRKLLRRRSSLVVADLPEGRPVIHENAAPSMLDGWGAPSPQVQQTSSLLDQWTVPAPSAPKPAPSMLEQWSMPERPKQQTDAAPSILDNWATPSQPASKPAASLLDDWTAPPTKPKATETQSQASTPSMLDSWTSTPQPASKPVPSLLDDWAGPVAKPKTESAKVESSAPSMLDQWSSPASTTSKTVPKPPSSMLDEWTAPVAKPSIASTKVAPPSLLDQWTVPSRSSEPVPIVAGQPGEPVVASPESTVESSPFLANPTMPTSMPNSTKDDAKPDEKKLSVHNNGALDSGTSNKEPQKKEGSGVDAQEDSKTGRISDEKGDEYKLPKGLKQPPPEAFKEPDPNSLLDAFGF